jgi:N6-L-threonylcarbamoyladenine synthase
MTELNLELTTQSEKGEVYILGIESSCDETSAAVLCNRKVLSNIIANQKVHEAFGGVVPELASRAHQKHIIPVVDYALKQAGVDKKQLHVVAFTSGPGLIGSLMVGTSFAKAFALALQIPIISVNHMQAHVLAHFTYRDETTRNEPDFPFLCLTVSGGHTQLIRVDNPYSMQLLGSTTDDAAGEAFDKIAKLFGLPYPGGPLIDKHAAEGNPLAFKFPVPHTDGFNFSFSGLKTSVLYFLQKKKSENPAFVEQHINDLCASVQHTIIASLMGKIHQAVETTGIRQVALAGGVSANKGLRKAITDAGIAHGWKTFIPPFEFCTDNAAMIAVAGYFKWLKGDFVPQSEAPYARFTGFGNSC